MPVATAALVIKCGSDASYLNHVARIELLLSAGHFEAVYLILVFLRAATRKNPSSRWWIEAAV